MPRLSVTITDEQYSRLEELSGEDAPYSSKSEAVRNLLQAGERLSEVEQQRDNLRQQLEAVNARNDDVDALAEYVERERELQREERERRRAEWDRRRARERAPIWRRAKWSIFGRDTDE